MDFGTVELFYPATLTRCINCSTEPIELFTLCTWILRTLLDGQLLLVQRKTNYLHNPLQFFLWVFN